MASFRFVHQCDVLIVVIHFWCLFLRGRTRDRDRVDNIEDQYLSIDIQFKKKNPKELFLFLVINEQGKQSYLILCFQSISILAKYRI
jgi:hypothetical protein